MLSYEQLGDGPLRRNFNSLLESKLNEFNEKLEQAKLVNALVNSRETLTEHSGHIDPVLIRLPDRDFSPDMAIVELSKVFGKEKMELIDKYETERVRLQRELDAFKAREVRDVECQTTADESTKLTNSVFRNEIVKLMTSGELRKAGKNSIETQTDPIESSTLKVI